MHFACDVLVAGSGAGGLAAAVTARKAGLDVLVAEKEPWFGGTTALSGGWLWIPNHPMQKEIGVADSIEDASTYLLHEAGEKYDPERVNAFLTAGPRMVEFFTRETAVQFDPSATFSDYHPDAPGGRPGGRSIVARAYDGRELGKMLKMLRPPLPELTVFGIMIGSGAELVHFMRWSKSFASAAFVARRLLGHGAATLFHGRGVRLTNGNALAGRLLKSALDAGVQMWSRCRGEGTLARGRRGGGRDSRAGWAPGARAGAQGRGPRLRRFSAGCGAHAAPVPAPGAFLPGAAGQHRRRAAPRAGDRRQAGRVAAERGGLGAGVARAAARRLLRPVPAFHRPREARRDRRNEEGRALRQRRQLVSRLRAGFAERGRDARLARHRPSRDPRLRAWASSSRGRCRSGRT